MKKPVLTGQPSLAQSGDKKTAKKKGPAGPLIRKIVAAPGIPLNEPNNVF